MKVKETVAGFYSRHGQSAPVAEHFHIYCRNEFTCGSISLPPNRRDFYKIALVLDGEGIYSSVDKAIDIKGNAIVFTNPLVPYSWEPTTERQTGYFCLFTEAFISPILQGKSLSQSQLFKVGGDPVFFPAPEVMRLLKGVFETLIQELQSEYPNKYDLIRSYVQIILHEALKMRPPETFYTPTKASARVSNFFLELLEGQFPIDSPKQAVRFKNANEFAAQLNIHTNTLNRALRDATGKTTSEWIAERIIKEAKALLHDSHWDIAEIAFCLGFEHSSNFHLFFKKQTGITPLQFRRNPVSIS